MTTGLVTAIERIDDIPLLLAQMKKIKLDKLLDKHFPTHGNWGGLTLGEMVSVWLSYILSEGDHRLNHVESWAGGLLMTLKACLGKTVRALDFSDDRLARILDFLGQDEVFEQFESQLNQSIIRVYDLKTTRVRIDSTTAKSYVSVTEDGLFQFGHSKDHRPDLPQLKINQSALDPLGIPLTTTIVSGEKADDPLYIPEIKKVQRSLQTHGVLYVGDCKMASLATRAYIAESGDFYLSPLSSVQMPAASMMDILRPVWNNKQELTKIYPPLTAENIEPEAIAEGFIYTATLQSEIGINGEIFSWDEQRLVVHSFKHAEKNKRILEAQTKKAMDAIAKLNQRGRGVKSLDEKELHRAVESSL